MSNEPKIPRRWHYFGNPCGGGFIVRTYGRCERPEFRFSDSPHRLEEWNRNDAARLIRAARRNVRADWAAFRAGN